MGSWHRIAEKWYGTVSEDNDAHRESKRKRVYRSAQLEGIPMGLVNVIDDGL